MTIVGPDASGYSWTCGQCGTTGAAAESDAAMADFNTHWDNAVIPPVDPWLQQILDTGQALADSSPVPPLAAAWEQAVSSMPSAVAVAWRNPGNIHPAG
ncbi:hypothetical protein ACFYW8_10780 [Streptomyces sp. NPDC002742]|uniref:hypothetical protein n=1 Tax=Streptomyces sp. NPDC002742 TaxID=3364663 RepID=UPI00369B8988